MSETSVQDKFLKAVNVIRNLPKNGSYQPSHELQLRFYGYYKQATEGPNTNTKPGMWQIVKRAKWEAWFKLGNMTKEEAMIHYVEELRKIVETMSYTENVATFLNSLDGFYENVPAEDLELLVGPIIEKMRSRPNSPLSGSPLASRDTSPSRISTSREKSPLRLNSSGVGLKPNNHITSSLDTSPTSSYTPSPLPPDTEEEEEEDNFLDTNELPMEQFEDVTKPPSAYAFTENWYVPKDDLPLEQFEKDPNPLLSPRGFKFTKSWSSPKVEMKPVDLPLEQVENNPNPSSRRLAYTKSLSSPTSDTPPNLPHDDAELTFVFNSQNHSFPSEIVQTSDEVNTPNGVNHSSQPVKGEVQSTTPSSHLNTAQALRDLLWKYTVLKRKFITIENILATQRKSQQITIESTNSSTGGQSAIEALNRAVEEMNMSLRNVQLRVTSLEKLAQLQKSRRGQFSLPNWWGLSLQATSVMLIWPIVVLFCSKWFSKLKAQQH